MYNDLITTKGKMKMGNVEIVEREGRWYAQGSDAKGNAVRIVGPTFNGFDSAEEAREIAEVLGFSV